MSKRNIAYIKPTDPNFLKRMKEEIGYKDDGPTVDTKREEIGERYGSDSEDEELSGKAQADDELPTVVVLRDGDLTAQEALAEEARIAKEESEKPADLSQRIIFKKKRKLKAGDNIESPESAPPPEDAPITVLDKAATKKSKSKTKTTSKLSFDEDEFCDSD